MATAHEWGQLRAEEDRANTTHSQRLFLADATLQESRSTLSQLSRTRRSVADSQGVDAPRIVQYDGLDQPRRPAASPWWNRPEKYTASLPHLQQQQEVRRMVTENAGGTLHPGEGRKRSNEAQTRTDDPSEARPYKRQMQVTYLGLPATLEETATRPASAVGIPRIMITQPVVHSTGEQHSILPDAAGGAAEPVLAVPSHPPVDAHRRREVLVSATNHHHSNPAQRSVTVTSSLMVDPATQHRGPATQKPVVTGSSLALGGTSGSITAPHHQGPAAHHDPGRMMTMRPNATAVPTTTPPPQHQGGPPSSSLSDRKHVATAVAAAPSSGGVIEPYQQRSPAANTTDVPPRHTTTTVVASRYADPTSPLPGREYVPPSSSPHHASHHHLPASAPSTAAGGSYPLVADRLVSSSRTTNHAPLPSASSGTVFPDSSKENRVRMLLQGGAAITPHHHHTEGVGSIPIIPGPPPARHHHPHQQSSSSLSPVAAIQTTHHHVYQRQTPPTTTHVVDPGSHTSTWPVLVEPYQPSASSGTTTITEKEKKPHHALSLLNPLAFALAEGPTGPPSHRVTTATPYQGVSDTGRPLPHASRRGDDAVAPPLWPFRLLQVAHGEGGAPVGAIQRGEAGGHIRSSSGTTSAGWSLADESGGAAVTTNRQQPQQATTSRTEPPNLAASSHSKADMGPWQRTAAGPMTSASPSPLSSEAVEITHTTTAARSSTMGAGNHNATATLRSVDADSVTTQSSHSHAVAAVAASMQPPPTITAMSLAVDSHAARDERFPPQLHHAHHASTAAAASYATVASEPHHHPSDRDHHHPGVRTTTTGGVAVARDTNQLQTEGYRGSHRLTTRTTTTTAPTMSGAGSTTDYHPHQPPLMPAVVSSASTNHRHHHQSVDAPATINADLQQQQRGSVSMHEQQQHHSRVSLPPLTAPPPMQEDRPVAAPVSLSHRPTMMGAVTSHPSMVLGGVQPDVAATLMVPPPMRAATSLSTAMMGPGPVEVWRTPPLSQGTQPHTVSVTVASHNTGVEDESGRQGPGASTLPHTTRPRDGWTIGRVAPPTMADESLGFGTGIHARPAVRPGLI